MCQNKEKKPRYFSMYSKTFIFTATTEVSAKLCKLIAHIIFRKETRTSAFRRDVLPAFMSFLTLHHSNKQMLLWIVGPIFLLFFFSSLALPITWNGKNMTIYACIYIRHYKHICSFSSFCENIMRIQERV